MDKSDLRRLALARRKLMSDEERARKDRMIHARVAQLAAVRDARAIMSYVSRPGEAGTHPLIRGWLEEGKRVCVPRTDPARRADPASRTMKAIAIRDFERDLAPGVFGILEPRAGEGEEIAPDRIDLHVVPGLMFDREGRRLGHGAGYYDRFLKGAAPRSRFLALAYNWQICDALPADPWDVLMHVIVTDEAVWSRDS